MTARATFRQMLAERRSFPRGSADWAWRTRAARKMVWIMRRKPVTEWSE